MFYCTFCIMGQQVNCISKRKHKKIIIVYIIWPETKRSNNEQALGWTRKCCKILRWFVIRGERLIKFSDSWFSTKSILVEQF